MTMPFLRSIPQLWFQTVWQQSNFLYLVYIPIDNKDIKRLKRCSNEKSNQSENTDD